jgi:tetratricopeptide (TPR) repeat protein
VRPFALATLSLLSVTVSAQAEPTLWQRAAEPQARIAARARLRAEQLFEQAAEQDRDPEARRELSPGSAALLELIGGPDSTAPTWRARGANRERDPWQTVLLGRVLLDADSGREQEALQLVERALVLLPDSDFKAESWFDVGVGAQRGGDSARAIRAFTAALALFWAPDDRANAYRNRAKAQMLLGNLQACIEDLRKAVALARDPKILGLSHFGLGVALERAGDYPQGMLEIARGVANRLPVPPYPVASVLDLPLSWTPEYDAHYYRALAAMSEAVDADSTETAEAAYESALVSWEQYLPAAEAQKDRFVANAKRHQKRCLEALERLQHAPAPRRSGRVR